MRRDAEQRPLTRDGSPKAERGHVGEKMGCTESLPRRPAPFRLVYERYLAHMKVLDVGCASGTFLRYFGCDSVGLDISLDDVRLCRTAGLNVIAADLNEGLPITDGSFEVAFCSHVLEHVDSPIDVLRELYRVLIPGGRVVVGIPTEHSISRAVLRDRYFRDHPGHVYGFSVDCIRRLFSLTGFESSRAIIDVPLAGRLRLAPLLVWGQRVPASLAQYVVANLWYVGEKARGD